MKKKELHLLDFQKEAIKYGIQERNPIFFVDRGLGKSHIAMKIFQFHKNKNPNLKCLLIAPYSLLFNWAKNIIEPFYDFSYQIFNPAKPSLFNEDIILVSYGRVKHIEISGPLVIILDESHKIKNYKAQRTRATLDLVRRLRRETDVKVILLTGTGITRNPLDLWTQFLITNKFREGRNKERYNSAKYLKKYKWDNDFTIKEKRPFAKFPIVVGFQNLRKLQNFVKDNAFVLSKEEALKDYKEPLFREIKIELSKKEKRIYLKLAKDLYNYITEHKFKISLGDISKYMSEMFKLSSLTSGKIKFINDYIDGMTEERILVWTRYISTANNIFNNIKGRFIKKFLITGELNNKERIKIVNEFNKSKKAILIATIQSLKEGFSVNTETMIYNDRTFNLEDRLQSLDRNAGIRRIVFNIKKPLVIDLVSHNTVDELTLDNLNRKESILIAGIQFSKKPITDSIYITQTLLKNLEKTFESL